MWQITRGRRDATVLEVMVSFLLAASSQPGSVALLLARRRETAKAAAQPARRGSMHLPRSSTAEYSGPRLIDKLAKRTQSAERYFTMEDVSLDGFAVFVAVAEAGGFRAAGGRLAFAPRLPTAISRLVFHLWYRDRRLRVTATREEVTYVLRSGEPLDVTHHGEPLVLTTDDAVSRPIPACDPPPRPPHALGRPPAARHPTADE